MKNEKDITETILENIDMMIGMVLESNGKYTRNTITIPMEIEGNGSYELVITFKEKGVDQ